MTRSLLALLIVAILGGCSTLPRDGPSGRAIDRGADHGENGADYAIVQLDYATAERIKAVPGLHTGSLAAASSTSPVDVIGSGDRLLVAIFEPSGNLFGQRNTEDGVRAGSSTLPLLSVDRNGAVSVPFAGSVRVAGLTTTEAAAAIRRALQGRVGNPQVTVAVEENLSNTVTVLGEVRQPGRAPLTVNGDTILDAIAAAGGSPRALEDVRVEVRRGSETFTAPLSAVTTDFAENVRLQRGDQINLVYVPRRFRTFGALGAVAEQDMPAGVMTLASALSRSGGLNDNFANARSVLVFRFERPEVAAALGVTQPATFKGVPVVYRLNLEEASGFFTANTFIIQPDDTIYAPRSISAEVRKFFEFVQQVSRVVYDVSVTNALNN
ncbi:MAG: polysaccharide biosynthesis/export family protein [Brevundimonas sp.]|uniref:polysaccharide biosynthesis/export family protein n=1 Tax=Brevundimonas sp. TaxID=1871086 RepID=UPI00273708AF|nr:polysaccharide biosynthesis/export family protein [Brevundimonas sp.]MDP3405181.1 polysaccharide biosynthesis/export family protein [Brevundimonas sp.]